MMRRLRGLVLLLWQMVHFFTLLCTWETVLQDCSAVMAIAHILWSLTTMVWGLPTT